MSKIIIPENYTPALNLYDTQRAIGTVKRLFADTLCATLNLYRVSAPLFVEASTGLNDDLNGVERKVTFDTKDSGIEVQVVQSLAKWKRKALKDYGFRVGKGLYCDMNAIRRDEELDNLHSVYVDQWDWEKVIRKEDRSETYLKNVVRSIVSAVCATEMNLHAMFPQLQDLPLHTPNVTFITTQELEDKYPDLTPKERENAFSKQNNNSLLWAEFTDFRGYCLEFDYEKIVEGFRHRVFLHGTVIYDEEEQMNGLLESLLSCIHSLVEKGAKDLQGFFEEDAIPSEESLNQLVDAMAVVCSVYTMFFKKSYFAGEEEYRFIFPPLHYEKGQDRPQFRLLDQIFLPYIMVELETEQQELPLQSVMVGAKNNSDIAVRGMKYFLKTQGPEKPSPFHETKGQSGLVEQYRQNHTTSVSY